MPVTSWSYGIKPVPYSMHCRTGRGRIITHGNEAAAAKEARGIAGSLDECLWGDKTDGARRKPFNLSAKADGAQEGKERRDQRGTKASTLAAKPTGNSQSQAARHDCYCIKGKIWCPATNNTVAVYHWTFGAFAHRQEPTAGDETRTQQQDGLAGRRD